MVHELSLTLIQHSTIVFPKKTKIPSMSNHTLLTKSRKCVSTTNKSDHYNPNQNYTS